MASWTGACGVSSFPVFLFYESRIIEKFYSLHRAFSPSAYTESTDTRYQHSHAARIHVRYPVFAIRSHVSQQVINPTYWVSRVRCLHFSSRAVSPQSLQRLAGQQQRDPSFLPVCLLSATSGLHVRSRRNEPIQWELTSSCSASFQCFSANGQPDKPTDGRTAVV